MERKHKCICYESEENCKACRDESDLVWASECGNNEKIIELVNSGSCVNSYSMYGSGALCCAVSMNHYDTVKLLIDMGANINREHRVAQAPIGLAIEYSDINIVKLLIDYGCEINYTKPRGGATIMTAIFNRISNDEEIAEIYLKLILDAGLDIDKAILETNAEKNYLKKLLTKNPELKKDYSADLYDNILKILEEGKIAKLEASNEQDKVEINKKYNPYKDILQIDL